jgi:hypothetical protein
VLTIPEHDSRWLAAVRIDQPPTRTALVLAAVRHVLATAAWVALAAAIVVVFWAGAATVLVPALGWLATALSAGVHVLIVWVEGVITLL